MCRSSSVLSCVDVIQSFTYVLRVVILDVTKRRGVKAREKARCNTNGLSQIPSKKEEEEKRGISGCGLFVVACFQPATSIDSLQILFHVCWSSTITVSSPSIHIPLVRPDTGLLRHNLSRSKTVYLFSSVQFKMVSMRSEKPICAPSRLSKVSPTLPLKRFQCASHD